jgi:hypothetical protein
MNTNRLLAVADLIEQANRFDLTFYAGAIDEMDEDAPDGVEALGLLKHHCNTAGCVAGWTLAWHYGDGADEFGGDEANEASLVLDLTESQQLRLFYPDRNPRASIWAQVADEYGWTPSEGWEWAHDITAAQAADVLRRIARGELTL